MTEASKGARIDRRPSDQVIAEAISGAAPGVMMTDPGMTAPRLQPAWPVHPPRWARGILVADADPDARRWLRTIIGERFDLEEVDHGATALARIAAGAARVVIVGRTLVDMSGAALVERAAPWRAPEQATFLLADRAGVAPALDEAQLSVCYRLARGMPEARVRALLTRAAAELPPLPPDDPDPAFAEVVGRHARTIGSKAEPEDAARAAIAAVVELVGADRARCLYCSETSGQLWSELEADGADATMSTGLVGFAVRAATAVIAPHAGDDAMYSAAIDNPGGTGREHLAIQPVAGPDGHVHAVLVAIRDAARRPFAEPERAKLAALAATWAPDILLLAMRVDADRIIGEQLARGPSHIFRPEAIASLAQRGQGGDVVRIHPGWVGAAYWLVLAAIASAITYAALTQVREYAAGAAVVRHADHRDVFADEAGTIAWLTAVPGQRVEGGHVLMRLDDSAQVDRLRALEAELAAAAPARSLDAIRAQLDRARLDLDARAIRAPHAGVVKEVRVRAGQRIEAGTAVVSLSDPTREELRVIAFLPGDDRPRLHLHQRVRLRLPGYRGARITSEVSAVSDVLSAGDARARFLGDRRDDRLPLASPIVVVVEARLASPAFEADGEQLRLYDGMIGLVEVEMRSRSLLESLLPGTR